ncbi:amino acid permease [Corynebacterium urealyticum]|uniref:Putative transporter n=1 Tax=Corynebacterium urealyticum (strain ATCC 43042 / DSM 7109) TaxID=504474 RepID=B1VFV4_CORU7|nr:amino acid permease [Corynebacterium urealyticum]QQC41876.1 amino acid permease [Corynebacterium urealyticum]QQE50499.1 amino acid permease [Corynebacterium urealyticum]CAQ04643.1 putative transporter [Corynebacterium urealyticum DSM 7109]SNV79559.1 transporter [Corynebacterium urealyticum]
MSQQPAPETATAGESSTTDSHQAELRRALRHRHIHFIALGSAIGTGLFYGSAGAIGAAGPGVIFVYLLGGAIVYFMLRALGEMSVAHPVAGSFAEYCRRYLGGWAGYITGWMYAFEMIIVCLADLTAVALYMKFWFPETASWVWVAVALIIVGAANLASARWFGELEFWFTTIKVTAVVAMILGGAAILVFNVDTGGTVGISNLWNDGGLFPNGFTGVLSALILVLFAFGGTEIIGVTASEAEDPEKTIPKAINTVPMRILLFYVLAIFVIVAVIPWREITGEQSPFVQIFSSLGIGWAAALLNVVVLSAALSAINSDLYGAGRVIHGMARQKLAPKMFAKIDPRNGVPVSTISALLIVLVIGVVLQLINPTAERLFQDIAALATFATIFVWLMILISHLAYRKHLNFKDVAHANFTVPLWPLGQYFAIAMILLTFGTMFWMSDFHSALIAGVVFTVAMSIRYYFIDRKNKAEAAAV